MTSANKPTNDWRSLQAVNAYRLLVSSGLIVSLILGVQDKLFGPGLAPGFSGTVIGYWLAAIAALVAARLRWVNVERQILATVVLDIGALNGLMLLSHGVRSGLGLLLLLPLAAAGLLLGLRLAGMLAAIAVLALLTQEAALPILIPSSHPDFFEAGLTGTYYLILVWASHWLAMRLGASQEMARIFAGRARRFRELNHQIIEQIPTGAMVVGSARQVRLLNRSAATLLGLPRETSEEQPLAAVAPQLARSMDHWRLGLDYTEHLSGPDGGLVFISYTHLTDDSKGDTLISIEDGRRQNERIQQLKLVSIGRLTASVSHEVRNPLSAISHATELLRESSDQSDDDERLLSIIERHIGRIDDITSRMLGLARRSSETRRRIQLKSWLAARAEDYCQSRKDPPVIDTSQVAPDTTANCDPAQLEQIVIGLWNNASFHARLPGKTLRVAMATGHDSEGRPWMDITDNGPGIETESLSEVLEPFYTTAGNGTGLGLHIARELAAANAARLSVRPNTRGACFRLTFNLASSDPPADQSP